MMTRCVSAGKSEHEHSLLDSSKIALAVIAFERSLAVEALHEMQKFSLLESFAYCPNGKSKRND